jgi:hypothetical protein
MAGDQHPRYPEWFAFEADVTLRGVLAWMSEPANNPAEFQTATQWRTWHEAGRHLGEAIDQLLSGHRPAR